MCELHRPLKDRRQMELPSMTHRCHRCGRELRNRKSIKRKLGPKCYAKKKDSKKKADDYYEGLRGLAAYENA
jgi:hypothetical protein